MTAHKGREEILELRSSSFLRGQHLPEDNDELRGWKVWSGLFIIFFWELKLSIETLSFLSHKPNPTNQTPAKKNRQKDPNYE